MVSIRLKSDDQSWGGITITLHWLVAATVIGLFILGLWMTGLDYYHSWYQRAPYIHKSVGILLMGVMILRLIWRLLNRPPAPLPNHAAWETGLAHAIHLALYLLLFAIMASGYMISTADGRAIEVFGWFEIPALALGIDRQEEIAGTLHLYLAVTLMGLVGLHAAGAMKHHFFDKDQTLRRMLKIG